MSHDPSNYQSHIEEYTSRSISRLSWRKPDLAAKLKLGTFGLLVTISLSGAVPNVIEPLKHLPTFLSP
jgi:hypothetical protein